MDFQEKIDALRVCVESEGDGGIALFGWDEKMELDEFIDRIEEGNVYD